MNRTIKDTEIKNEKQETITIKFVPDASTKLAMEKLEGKRFRKEVEKEVRMLASFKLAKF